MFKGDVQLLVGQIWSLGKNTIDKVKEKNQLSHELGNEGFRLIELDHEFILVEDVASGFQFDVGKRNLGSLLSQKVRKL